MSYDFFEFLCFCNYDCDTPRPAAISGEVYSIYQVRDRGKESQAPAHIHTALATVDSAGRGRWGARPSHIRWCVLGPHNAHALVSIHRPPARWIQHGRLHRPRRPPHSLARQLRPREEGLCKRESQSEADAKREREKWMLSTREMCPVSDFTHVLFFKNNVRHGYTREYLTTKRHVRAEMHML